MVDYVLLKTEIAKPAYVGLTDAQVAAAVNAGTYQVKQDIPTDLGKMALIHTTAYDWGELEGVAIGAITAGQLKRKRCITFKALIDTQTPLEVAADDAWWAFIVQLLSEMVADGVITNAGKLAFEALRLRVEPLWRKFGERELDFNDIVQARAA